MARLFSSGFELNNTTADVEFTNSSDANFISTTTVRSGTYAGYFYGTIRCWYDYKSSNSQAVEYYRCYVNFASFPGNADAVILSASQISGGAAKIQIRITTDGYLKLYNFEDSAQVGSNSLDPLTTGDWYRIELKVDTTTLATTAVEALIDGISFASGTVNLAGGVGSIVLGNDIADIDNLDFYVDDVAVNDSTGSFQNSWPGIGKIIHLQPDSSGDVEDWGPYTNIAEVTPDDASTKNSSNTLNQESLYNLSASGLTALDTVNVVAVGVRFNGAGASANAGFKLEIEASASGTIEQSAEITPTDTTWVTNASAAPRNYALVLYDLPGGSTTAWTNTDLDAAQTGFKLTTASTNEVQISTVWLLVDYTPDPLAGEEAVTSPTLSSAEVMGPLTDTQVATGAYVGDGLSSSQVVGVGFRPSLVWIWGASEYAVWSSDSLPANKTLYFSNAAVGFTGGITGFLPDGFTIGNNSTVNTATKTYYYMAFRDNGAGNIDIGSYIGNGSDNRAITSPGFQPDFIHIKGDTAQAGCYRYSSGVNDSTYLFTGATATDHIQAMLTTGFEIGTNARVNSNAVTYYYFAFKKQVDFFDIGTYTGNGLNNIHIGTIFKEALVMIQKTSGTAQVPVYMPLDASSINTTLNFANSVALTTAILQIQDPGFKIGTHATVNTNGTTYVYFIWKNPAQSNLVRKYYEYRVYDSNVYQKSWTNEVLTQPSFRNVINGGPGEVIVRLDRSFDDFGENDDVKLNNRVDIWVYDRQFPNGQRLYRGFISGYRPVLDGNKEYVEVTILSYIFELGYYMLRDGTGATEIAYSSQDPSTILTDIIDKYRADGGTISYNPTSIQTTGTTVSYTFNSNTVREAIDKVIELAPLGWYWTVDANSIIYLKPKSTTATHAFTIGTHIAKMETWRRIEDVVNRVYFTGFTTASGTGMYRIYSNTGSISSYGLHAIHKVDGRVTNTLTADTMSNRILSAKIDPEIRTAITIVDNNGENKFRGYDIESVVPGDTMKIKNIKMASKTTSRWDQAIWDTDIWDATLAFTAADVIQILSFDYNPDYLTIEASSRLPEISKRIEDIDRNLTSSITVDNPSDPTAG